MILPPLLPAGHSPSIEPDAVWVLAAIIASGRVQKPSFAMTGDVLFTIIVVVGAVGPFGAVGAAKLKYVSRLAAQKKAHAVMVRSVKIPD